MVSVVNTWGIFSVLLYSRDHRVLGGTCTVVHAYRQLSCTETTTSRKHARAARISHDMQDGVLHAVVSIGIY